MKIAVNTRFLISGRLENIGKFTHEILRRLTARYPQHEFHFFFDRTFDQRFIYGTNVKPAVLYPSVRHPVLYYWWYQVRLARALKKLKPDVFLSFDGMTTLKTTVPRVTVMYDLAFEHNPQEVDPISRKYFKYYGPRVVHFSSKIIAVSPFTRQEICRQYNVPPEKIAVVPFAVGEEFFKINFEKQVAVRGKYTRGEAYFFSVGTLQERHNLHNLFRAFDIFKQKTGSEVKLVLVGSKTRLTGAVKKAYGQMQYKSEVIFTSSENDAELVLLYGAAVATVYVPAYEGFGLPVIEAQQCGCPVITANTSALPEVAGAIQVNPLAVEEISDALIKVYHELDVRARLVQDGYRNAQRFSWERSSEDVMRVLEEVVQANQSTSALL